MGKFDTDEATQHNLRRLVENGLETVTKQMAATSYEHLIYHAVQKTLEDVDWGHIADMLFEEVEGLQ
jgi:oligoendopeptidase F